MIGEYRACTVIGDARLSEEVDYVSFTGDFGFSGWSPTNEVIENHLAHESSLLSMFQLNVINLEYMLRGFSGSQLDKRIDQLMVNILEKAGYGLIARANNHALDHGVDGVSYNTAQLVKTGLSMVGIRDFPVYEYNAKGKRVAIFSLTDDTDQENQKTPILGMNESDLALIQRQITGAHFRIAFVHLGSMSSFPSAHERKQVDRLIDIGADLVVCTGSHFIKGVVKRSGKPVAYGIGNHIFSFVDSDTEPIGMHLVAGFNAHQLTQLFVVPFRNTIREGKTGPLDEASFDAFKQILLERSIEDSDKYFSDPRSLRNFIEYLRDFRFSKVKDIKIRHVAYAMRILFYHYPVMALLGVLLALVIFVITLHWTSLIFNHV
jgi:uncharacterized membrane protein